MVSRCIEALDRLEEISQQILKKSSMQDKIRNIERRLNRLKLKEEAEGNRKIEITAVQSVQKIRNTSNKLRKKRVSPVRKQVRLKKDGIGQGMDGAGAVVSQESRSRNCSNETVENCKATSKKRLPEPLSWEEQLNSELATVVEHKQQDRLDGTKSEGDIVPVVFHDKKWIEELLLNKHCKYQFPSFNLPVFQRENEIGKRHRLMVKHSNTKRQSKSWKNKILPGEPVLGISSASLDQPRRTPDGEESQETELKGLAVTSSPTLPEMPGAEGTSENDRKNSQTFDMIDKSMSIEMSQDSSTRLTTDSKPHFDISLPNVDYSETIADDCQSLMSQATLPLDTLSLPEEIQDKSDITKFQSRPLNDIGSKLSYLTNNDEMRYSGTDIAERKDFSLPKSAPHLSKDAFQKCPKRCSSRLVYTPSSTPLFFADEIVEFPRSVSPVKKLLELRQTFCENMKKETEQLQFDLEQLYLKKELHKR